MLRKKIALDPAEELADLVGSTVVSVGVPRGGTYEGGGLAIEYVAKGEMTPRTLIIEFNELGFWLSS